MRFAENAKNKIQKALDVMFGSRLEEEISKQRLGIHALRRKGNVSVYDDYRCLFRYMAKFFQACLDRD